MADDTPLRQTTPNGIRHGLYLTCGKDGHGRLIAICSDGSPQLGHEGVTVLTLEVVKSPKEARRWFERVRQERPWEARH